MDAVQLMAGKHARSVCTERLKEATVGLRLRILVLRVRNGTPGNSESFRGQCWEVVTDASVFRLLLHWLSD